MFWLNCELLVKPIVEIYDMNEMNCLPFLVMLIQEKLSVLDFVDGAGAIDPVEPPPLESTPFKLVEQVKDLKELAAKLRRVDEFAVRFDCSFYFVLVT